MAAYDQALAAVKDAHPGHCDAWYDAWMARAAWYLENHGDMAGAPALPDDDFGSL